MYFRDLYKKERDVLGETGNVCVCESEETCKGGELRHDERREREGRDVR